MTRYGPHDETTQPASVIVLRRHREGGEHRVPIDPRILRQRAQLNDLAHLGVVSPDHRGRVPDPPFCRTCGRDQEVCLGSRHGDDDHPFEPSRRADP